MGALAGLGAGEALAGGFTGDFAGGFAGDLAGDPRDGLGASSTSIASEAAGFRPPLDCMRHSGEASSFFIIIIYTFRLIYIYMYIAVLVIGLRHRHEKRGKLFFGDRCRLERSEKMEKITITSTSKGNYYYNIPLI